MTAPEIAKAGEEDLGEKFDHPDARNRDGKGKKRGRKRDDDNGSGCEAWLGEVQMFELPVPWWDKNARGGGGGGGGKFGEKGGKG